MDSYIEVKNLTKTFGKNIAINNLNFNIKKGEIIGILGANGAGKSTFVSLLTATLKPTSGEILINNNSLNKNSIAFKKIIGFVPQDIALYSMLSGLDNLKFWAGIFGIHGKAALERIREVTEIVKLTEQIEAKVETYSGGMKRRLNVAVSMLHQPEILILDEPTVGIDIQSKKFIFNAINELKSKSKTIVLVSHYIDDIEYLCDRILLLEKGILKAIGTKDEFLKIFNKENLQDILLNQEAY